MPAIIGTTSMKLFLGDFLAGGTFINPFNGNHRSTYAGLYGPTRGVIQMYSRLDESFFDRFGPLSKIKDDVSSIITSAQSGNVPGYVAGVAGAYNDTIDLFRRLEDKLSVDSQLVEIVYPNQAFDFIEFTFDAFSQEDTIRDFFVNPKAPARQGHRTDEFGISVSTPRTDESNVPVEGDTWHNHSKIVYRINLRQLLDEKGDGAYGELPLTFGFGMTSTINGDMWILQFMNLKIVRPPSPRITKVNNIFVSVGDKIKIDGENFLGTSVTIAGANAEIEPGSLNAYGMVVTIPPEAAHVDTTELIITTPGGSAHNILQIHRPLTNVRCDRSDFKAGDIINILGVGLERTATIEFLRHSHFGPFDPSDAPREYPTTWLLLPGRAGGELDNVDLRQLRVSVPAGMSDQVSIRITQQYSSERVVIGPFTYNPGAPMIESIQFIEHLRSNRFNISGHIKVLGFNLLYSPVVFWGGSQVTQITSDAPNSLSFVPPSGVHESRVELRTPFGVALSSDSLTIPSGGGPPE